jgi:hypothetical protein
LRQPCQDVAAGCVGKGTECGVQVRLGILNHMV